MKKQENQEVFLSKVQKAFSEFGFLPDEAGKALTRGQNKILVALSGGADSCALFYSLLSLSEQLSLDISAAHVNHMIRSIEADRDESFVRSICEKEKVPLFCERFDVPKIAKEKGMGLEETAREVRYTYFSALCKEHGFLRVATAHTASDNTETVLFNIVRGSSLDGLCGIAPMRDIIIRPLILVTRKEVEEFLFHIGKEFVTDSTNFDTDYSRNFLRNEIIPQLRRLNPSIENAFTKSSRLLRRDRDFLNGECEKYIADETEKLKELPEALLSRILLKKYYSAGGKSVSLIHLSALMAQIKSYNGSEKRISLPNHITAFIGNKVTFIKNDFVNVNDSNANESRSFHIILKYGKNIVNEDYAVVLSKGNFQDLPESFTEYEDKEEIIYKISKNISVFSDTIKDIIFARSRRNGDCYKAGNMTRRIKKYLIDKKIPKKKRDRIPVICDSDGIIWFPGLPVCDRCHIKDVSIEREKTIISIFERQKN